MNSLVDGVYAAALTPMHEDLTCDLEELTKHCFDLVSRGCKGIVLFGTTGEGPSFSNVECKAVIEKLISKGFDPNKILLCNGSANIPNTVDLALSVLQHGCAGFLVTPPCFYKNVEEEGVIAFYREIIQRVDNPKLRIILYHIPQYSGVPITLKIIQTLREEFPDIVIGIKESEGNLPLTKKIIDACPGFKVYVGNERHIIEAVHHGAAGSICGLANLYPEMMCSLYAHGKRGFSSNPQELESFFQAMKGLFFVPAFKAIMEKQKGSSWNRLRPPLTPLDRNKKDAFLSNLGKASF